jgi:uncharacterized integral membrane protein
MSTGIAAGSPQADRGLPAFASLQEAVETAGYIEEVLEAEHQWITNRMSWLFVSQSFLLVAFVTFIVSRTQAVGRVMFLVLTWGMPLVGLITCCFVSLGIIAAHHEAKKLADVRAKLTIQINTFSPVQIPLIGVAKKHRDTRWTHYLGSWPHLLLPWVLTALWIAVLLALSFDYPRF